MAERESSRTTTEAVRQAERPEATSRNRLDILVRYVRTQFRSVTTRPAADGRDGDEKKD
jgi:hypothetical protein